MSIINDITNFFRSLSLVDIVFLSAVVTLIILIVTLIYFIKINKDVLEDDILGNTKDNNKKDDAKDKNAIIDKIIEEHTDDSLKEEYNDEEGELLDLDGLTKKLQKEKEEGQVKIDKYEQEQEEKAIISYDELLEKKNNYAINYEKEEVVDDLIIKKVNLNDLVNKDKEEEDNSLVKLVNYDKEEEFLRALKELNSILN